MAMLNSFSTIAAILVISGVVMVHPDLSYARKEPRHASPDDIYIESLPKKFKDFVVNCTHQITESCSEEVVGAVFKKANVSITCCDELVRLGLECHNALTKALVGFPEIKRSATLIQRASTHVFDHCVKIDKHHKHKHHPILP